jgi:hypothetical protein
MLSTHRGTRKSALRYGTPRAKTRHAVIDLFQLRAAKSEDLLVCMLDRISARGRSRPC